MNDLRQKMLRLWESACCDRPLRPSAIVKDGQFVMTITGNREQWENMCDAAGIPAHAEQVITGNTLTVRWPSIADEIFGQGGKLAQHLSNYQPRDAQLHMARLVQRSIEMNQPAMIEAGTGTGKSFAYAAVCMAMNKKVVIAAPTLALQMQLYRKDIPFLQTIFPDKKCELAMGKTNYVCQAKAVDQNAGAYSILTPAFIDWYEGTTTGNTLELSFQLTFEEQKAVVVDDDCTGKHCPNYDSCFYYQAKAARNEADVVITNHSLVALHFAMPTAKLLPAAFDVLVIDEAHQLPDYVRNALGSELTPVGIERTLHKALQHVDDISEAKSALHQFNSEIASFLIDKEGREVGINGDRTFKHGQTFGYQLQELAEEIYPSSDMPCSADEVRLSKAAARVRRMADNVLIFSSKTDPGNVRYINVTPEKNTYCHTPFDVSWFISKIAGYVPKAFTSVATPNPRDYTICTRCGRTLSSNQVAILDGHPYGPDCIQKIDMMGDAEVVNLHDWLDQNAHVINEPEPVEPARVLGAMPVIFTSATLAAPDMEAFMRECGIEDGLQMQALSPFDYKANSLLYVPSGAVPQPGGKDAQAHQEFVSQELMELVTASRGGAFLLFTSFSSMNAALRNLRQTFQFRGWDVLVQGEYPKLELVKRFKDHGHAVLFATKSFWEGVDIQGEALRLVVIDKLPFEAPNPLNTAQEAALRTYAETELQLKGNQAQWYPFNAMRVPKMITDLKQGAGRLIRTAEDYGVIAILDPRLRTTDYGRRMVLPSLPPARLTDSLEVVSAFYATHRLQPTPIKDVTKASWTPVAVTEDWPF